MHKCELVVTDCERYIPADDHDVYPLALWPTYLDLDLCRIFLFLEGTVISQDGRSVQNSWPVPVVDALKLSHLPAAEAANHSIV